MPEWPHEVCDPDTISELHTGDVCPWCGKAIRNDEEVIHFKTRERGVVWDLSPDAVDEPLLHPECFRETAREAPELFRQERDERPLSDFE